MVLRNYHVGGEYVVVFFVQDNIGHYSSCGDYHTRYDQQHGVQGTAKHTGQKVKGQVMS